MIGDYFRFSYNSLRTRRLRTSLTMIGIFIGIAAVVALVSLGQGMQQAINTQFAKVGIDKISIMPGGINMGPGSGLSANILTEKDLDVVKKTRGVENAIGIYAETAPVEFEGETKYLTIWAGPTDAESLKFVSGVSFFDIENGRPFKSGDRFNTVLGYNIAKDAFDKEIKVGDKITISGTKFSVIGTQKKAGTGIHDALIRIPLDVARELLNETQNEISMIMAQSSPGETPSVVAERINEELRKSRDVKKGEEDFSAQTAEQTIKQLNQILDIIQVFLVSIAAISLLVGGIGIMNTMYTAVVERTREIGIMKSIGAKNSQVFLIFLIESGLLGVVGGAIGVVLGLMLSKATEIIALQMGAPEIFRASFSWYIIVGALAFSFIVGAASGALPAYNASKLNPVEAIRKR